MPRSILAALVVTACTPLYGQGRSIVAVALSGVDSVALLDAHSLARVATVAVGRNPHEIAASREGRTLYIANAGGRSISVIDISAQPRVRAVWPLPDSISVHDIVVGDAGVVWGVSGAPAVLLGMDTATGTVRHRYPLQRVGSWMIEAGGPQGTLVVANLEGGAVSLVQPASGRETIFEAAVGEIDALATRERTHIWSVNSQTGDLTIFDSRSGRIVKRVHAGQGPVRVVFTPDGNTALVPLARDSTVLVYDVSTQLRVGTVVVGPEPKVIAVSADGRRAYVTHPRGALTVFDVRSLTVLRSIPLTGTPDGVALAEPR